MPIVAEFLSICACQFLCNLFRVSTKAVRIAVLSSAGSSKE